MGVPGLSILAHRLVHPLPRDESLWVFGTRGGEAFEGNTKYLFLALQEEESIRPVWLSKRAATVHELRENGFEAYRTDSLRGRLTMLRAGVVFVTGTMTDMALWPTGGARVVQLWHGVPLKRIAADAPSFEEFSIRERLGLSYTYRQFDALTLTAAGLADAFRSAFRIDSDLPVTGYPRNDALFREIPGEDVGQPESARGIHEDIDAERLLVYLPTYREDGSDPGEHVDFERLDRFLAERDAALVVKLHPFSDPDFDPDRFDRIRLLPAGSDIYPLLRETDALVTDYSSVYFDFLLLDRPVAFYAYDRERYEHRPGFYHAYEQLTPGPVAETFDGLLDALDLVLDSPEAHADERERVRAWAFDHHDDRSAERVREYVRVRFGV
ncbi:CDP-glycerol glycerophosphotransferase family protein [Halalkalicoccus jeotgali]|uniref:Glycosyl/glycerophosphate transferase n=1 Tax=Halalkalicoccus jeotgali (strain DSM 18796 / CECT 7217 / JCM 14584 / KCTC 4019 / B3) TaxID=795797 RepID=D8J6E4_HALJB|nr:CDP-glycerol glycerophosphotransferase family protein [Halalkalicoccus jeotgali]ADJ15862.1 glycosyl/glycerophosphate transferase [Halalkalicoccus jeotgali B3]ELY37958.1 glycosyl/glycerophosphate transferase [Halalkalicoccus jeotgali B3]